MFVKNYRYVREILFAERTPRQIACGIAIGIAIGLLPKANLICASLVLSMFMLRTNLAAGLVSALLLTWISPMLDPFTHRLGSAVLSWATLQPVWATLYRLPFGAWTSFNNSIVMGNTILIVALVGPTYLVISRRLGPKSISSWRGSAGIASTVSVAFSSTPETEIPAPEESELEPPVPAPQLKKRQKFLIGRSTVDASQSQDHRR